MPKYVPMKQGERSCDICNTSAPQLYLVPYRTLQHSDRCLCEACLRAKGYDARDVKIVYFDRAKTFPNPQGADRMFPVAIVVGFFAGILLYFLLFGGFVR